MKNDWLTIRVSEEEKVAITAKAERHGLSVSSYIRMILKKAK